MLVYCNRDNLANLATFSVIDIGSTRELQLKLFKFGNLVFCSGSFIVKENYIYSDTIPNGFRPISEASLTGQELGETTVISTGTLFILKDGTLKTKSPYKNKLCFGSCIWRTA